MSGTCNRVTIAQRISTSWERDGLTGLLQRGASHFLRRAGWYSEAWARHLDHHLAARVVKRRYGSLLQRNESFRNRHQGSRCFVIGNGPSLNKQDLAPLANEITFVTNYFNRHPIISESWQPKYYCLSDPTYFDGGQPLESFREIVNKVPRASFFVPHYASEFLRSSAVLPADRTFYVGVCSGLEGETTELPDFTTVTPSVQTVVQLGIMAAMFMGCTRIYLLGLDHDWLTQCGVTNNFYPKEGDKNEANAGVWNYKSLMEAVTRMWHIYEMHQRIAAKHDIRIINATAGGFLDVFERACYEDIISATNE